MSLMDEAKSFIDDALERVESFLANFFGDTEAVETLRIEAEVGVPLPAVGILKDMGYHVGKTGLMARERREILRRTFRVQLVATSPWTEKYIREWGERCSPARLDKMDRVLGGLIANAKRKTKVDMSEAIRDWNEDQQWLRTIRAAWLTHTHER